MEMLRLMAMLLLIILLIVIGNSFINTGDYTVISGNMSITGSSNKTETIAYPNGFTYQNCVLISLGMKVIDNKGYNYYGVYQDSSDLLQNNYRRRLNLISDGIKLTIFNPNSDSTTVYYKIVLMKVN